MKSRSNKKRSSGDDEDDDSPPTVESKDYYVLSKDYLRNSEIDQSLPAGWSNHAPSSEELLEKNFVSDLKRRVRSGVPPALRCAVWITCAVRSAQPHRDEITVQEYGTLGKVATLDHGWCLILRETFAVDADEEDALLPDFGLGAACLDQLLCGVDDGTLERMDERSLTRVLCAVRHHLGTEYCPLLPHLASLLLRFGSESHAYHTLREMVHVDPGRFVPVSEAQHHAWCVTFRDLMTRMHPKTARFMMDCDALSPEGLDPIFKRFFAPLLRHEHVLRIMDVFVVEGAKALFRFGVALIVLFKKQLKRTKIPNAALWWAETRTLTYDPSFDFNVLLKRAYGFFGSRARKRVRFPRRRTLSRMIKRRESWAEDNVEFEIALPPTRPLGLVLDDDDDGDDGSSPKPVLARPAAIRSSLANWVPSSLRDCRLQLVYSTDVHGRTLERFYDKVRNTKRTVTLVRVLNDVVVAPLVPRGSRSGENHDVVGAYASQAWHRTNRIYGDGECFLFSFMIDSGGGGGGGTCFKWRPRSAGSVDDVKTEALMEQFMISTGTFLAMGGNRDGTAGLRINEDLTRGETATALGFDNEPLTGTLSQKEFEIGLVEVYRFVGAVDGRPVDGEEDKVWNL